MLHELDVLEVQNIADLALAARKVRDHMLEKIADVDLGEPVPARGEHNPGHDVALNGVLAGQAEFIALREALIALPREIREKTWVISQIGRGDRAILDWNTSLDAASRLGDDNIVGDLLGEPDLHDLLRKGLYALGAATGVGDAT